MHTIIVGTRNLHKVREIAEITAGMPVRFLSLHEWGEAPEVVEDGKTFRENAIKKATELANATGQWVIGEDSGLEVDALNGKPGVLSARYSGPGATDEKNNDKLLLELEGVPECKRGAGYVSAIALAKPDKLLGVVEGACRGVIGTERKGAGGFGYDPLFFVPELGRTFAEVSSERKHAISHRGRALEKLKILLSKILDKEN